MISIDLLVHRPHPGAERLVKLPARPLTLDDIRHLAANDDSHHYELSDGNLLVRPVPDAEHAAILTRTGAWLAGAYAIGRVLVAPGLSLPAESTGRSPDIVLLRAPAPTATGWIEAAAVTLVLEVVSPGSETLDRVTKPGEYARAGIPHFWRVERDGPPTVHLYRLGVDERGGPKYIGHRAVLLDDLLAAPPPRL